MDISADCVMDGDPISNFVQSLKICELQTIQSFNSITEDRTVIIGFDKEKFLAKCTPKGSTYDPMLADYDRIAAVLFTEGELWASRSLLHQVMKSLAGLHGWTTTLDRRTVRCNRFGKNASRTEKQREFTTGPLRQDCTFSITLKPMHRERTMNANGTKFLYKDIWDDHVEISRAVTNHGGGCCPSATNRVVTLQRSGCFVRQIPVSAIFTMCHILESGRMLKSDSIYDAVRPHWPKQKEITGTDVFNIRVRVMRLMPLFRHSNKDYEAFKESFVDADLMQGIDNLSSVTDDDAYDLASSMWLEISSSKTYTEESLFSFIEYLDLIASRAKGFVYELAEDAKLQANGTKKLLGVVWMTATMWRNLELYGWYLCFDMMKRGINTLLWPYVAVTMTDDLNELCLGCEGIVCGERLEKNIQWRRQIVTYNVHLPG
ncbi:hypothetical protein ACHAXR_009974 [Thalassiosira sp. AJA248-18]